MFKQTHRKPPPGSFLDLTHPHCDNLAARWVMNEGSGIYVKDYGPYSAHATFSGNTESIISWVGGSGEIGDSPTVFGGPAGGDKWTPAIRQINGVSAQTAFFSCVGTGGTGAQPGLQNMAHLLPFSMVCAVRAHTTSVAVNICSKGSWVLNYDNVNNTISFFVNYGTFGNLSLSNKAIGRNEWVHVAIVKDYVDSPSGGHLQIFINGVDYGNTTGSWGITGYQDDAANNIELFGSGNKQFTGLDVSDISLYRQSLTREMVLDMMAHPYAAFRQSSFRTFSLPTVQTLQVQLGVAAIEKTTLQTQTGKGYLVKEESIVGKSNITASTIETLTGKANITASTIETLTGKAALEKVTTRDITGVTRVTSRVLQTQTGISYLAFVAVQTQTGVANITATKTNSITGKGFIFDGQHLLGKASILSTTLRTETGKAWLNYRQTQTQAGKAYILHSASISGKGNIYNTTLQTYTGIAKISDRNSQSQTGKADIKKAIPQLLLGIARVAYVAGLKTQAGKGSIAKTTLKTNTGVAQIAGSINRANLGVANIWVACRVWRTYTVNRIGAFVALRLAQNFRVAHQIFTFIVKADSPNVFNTDQDPVAKLTYVIDWSLWLGPGDTISGVDWTIVPSSTPPTNLVIHSSSYTSTTAKAVLKEGLVGITYAVKAKITTVCGEVDARTIQLHVVDR